jgi:hypothetical protein
MGRVSCVAAVIVTVIHTPGHLDHTVTAITGLSQLVIQLYRQVDYVV